MESYELLEREWAEFNELDPKNMVVCSSGSAALHLACEVLLPKDQQVIVPEYTMIACARAVAMAGSRLVFADCGDDLNLTVESVKDLGNNAGAVMPVHVYGRPCDMESIMQLVANYSMLVIEDMSEAHGMTPHRYSDAACWSFYRNKIIAGEEGGAVYFSNRWNADRARLMRCHGFSKPGDYHCSRGWNYRLSNANAEPIRSSLANYEANLAKRINLFDTYRTVLGSDLMRDPFPTVPWVFDVRLNDPIAAKVVDRLLSREVPARGGFVPMSQQAEYRGHYRHLRAYEESLRTLYLPLDPTLSLDTVRGYARALLEAIKGP